jgi:NitT/TauT family transport system ATP-binding protein
MSVAPLLPSGQQAIRHGRIEIRGLTKQFGDSDVYRNFNLDLQEGEFVSIFGPNGCGKSTFINLISGMIPIDFGTVLYDGKTIEQTRLSYVFQNYREALFPWMRAISNIQYPLKILGLDKNTQSRSCSRSSISKSTLTATRMSYQAGNSRWSPSCVR